jgi:DNA-binding MarR family transcriptional regulator
MSRRPSTQDDRALYITSFIRLAAQANVERYAKWLAGSGYDDIQPAHGQVFQPLWSRPEGARITTLARLAHVTKQTISPLVDHLERRGYVTRVPDPDDARASLVRLTARGRAYARAARGCARDIEADWIACLGASRVHDLREALATYLAARGNE